MTVDNGVRIVAGCMLLLSLILTAWVHPGFVWLSAFVGVNLIQSAFTGFCPAAMILKRMGFLHKMQVGDTEPIYEKLMLKYLGIDKTE